MKKTSLAQKIAAIAVPAALVLSFASPALAADKTASSPTRTAARMTAVNARADAATAKRVAALTALTARVNAIVHLTADQKAFARRAIQTGRLHREEDAVQEALILWEERERTRAELLSVLDIAESSIAQGRGRVITRQSMSDLAAEVNQRGRARLAAEEAAAL